MMDAVLAGEQRHSRRLEFSLDPSGSLKLVMTGFTEEFALKISNLASGVAREMVLYQAQLRAEREAQQVAGGDSNALTPDRRV